MPSQRFNTLDIFRGITICFMIVVNTSGAGAEPFVQLQHAPWFGITLADLVFPSFLFAVGNSMVFALKKPMSDKDYFLKVARRAAIMFLLGYLMYWFPFVERFSDGAWALKDIGHTRIMGVLQRIALCYFFAAIIIRYVPAKGLIALSVAILFLYWGALMWLGPVGEQLSMTGNIGAQLDRAILGLDHMYRLGAKGYEPEGLFSTLPAIVNVIAGYLIGQVIINTTDHRQKLKTVIIAGLALIAIALVWNLGFPFSKRLWTSSFVALTLGFDCLFLALIIFYTEIKKQTFGITFFEIFGLNPLVIYLFSELFVTALQLFTTPNGTKLYDWVGIYIFQPILPGAIGSLACAIAYMLTCWLLGLYLYKQKLIIKI